MIAFPYQSSNVLQVCPFYSRLIQLLREGASVLKGLHGVKYDQTEVKVLKFFWSAFELVYRYTLPYIQDPQRKYIITGHSLGGALASMMAIKGAVDHVSSF